MVFRAESVKQIKFSIFFVKDVNDEIWPKIWFKMKIFKKIYEEEQKYIMSIEIYDFKKKILSYLLIQQYD